MPTPPDAAAPLSAAASPGAVGPPTRGRHAPHSPGRAWRRVPRPLRRLVAASVGSALVLLGAVLIVLPGPFTLPPVLLGLAVLGSEFGWARRLQLRLLHTVRQGAAQVRRRTRGR